MKRILFLLLMANSIVGLAQKSSKINKLKPNVICIYADDLGYGDLSCYGATNIQTPNLDKLAAEGIRFTNGHATSATCTPSRFAFITGQYPWRTEGVNILPGDAALIIPTNKATLPKLFKGAGYKTAIVGKWHLGLGDKVEKDWNGEVKPGPNEVGFDYSFIFPATADRVPTIFSENHKVLALDSNDPIQVDYTQQIGTDPTGKDHPELLKLQSSPGHGHNQTIVNGIGRIGYMSGGKLARWVDEELSSTFLTNAKSFIEENQKSPFFLYFALTEPHVPRMPALQFRGKSGLGLRGDAILQLDWTVGEIVKQLKALHLEQNTIIVFTSDNGPVLDDGYVDNAKETYKNHPPAGKLRGGKYSAFEGGTRVPFIIKWPAKIAPKVSPALVSQVDLLGTFASIINQPIPKEARDSKDLTKAFLGQSDQGRSEYIAQGGSLSLIKDGWKYISPSNGPAYNKLVQIETGNLTTPQLYNLSDDVGERNNLANKYPEKVNQMAALLEEMKK